MKEVCERFISKNNEVEENSFYFKIKKSPISVNYTFNSLTVGSLIKNLKIDLEKDCSGINVKVYGLVENVIKLIEIYVFTIEIEGNKFEGVKRNNFSSKINNCKVPLIFKNNKKILCGNLSQLINAETYVTTVTGREFKCRFLLKNSGKISFLLNPLRLFSLMKFFTSELHKVLEDNESFLEICGNVESEIGVFLRTENLSKEKTCFFQFLELYYKIALIEVENLIVNNREDLIVSHRGNKISFYGLIDSINQSLGHLKAKAFSHFNVDQETKEFLSGKKSGKINKIIKMTNCPIETVDRPFPLSISYLMGPAPLQSVVTAIGLINCEYPSMLLFNVNAKHHKKIIGTSGKHIQKIMKKYDVYVKFMNEAEASLYPMNVICKTPCKNKENLLLIKEEILNNISERPEEPFLKEESVLEELPKIYDMLILSSEVLHRW